MSRTDGLFPFSCHEFEFYFQKSQVRDCCLLCISWVILISLAPVEHWWEGLRFPWMQLPFFATWQFFQDQIIRFGGDTDQSLPWPEKYTKEDENTMERPTLSGLGIWWFVFPSWQSVWDPNRCRWWSQDCAETATWLQLLLPASLPLKQRPALAGSHDNLSYLVVCGGMRLVRF